MLIRSRHIDCVKKVCCCDDMYIGTYEKLYLYGLVSYTVVRIMRFSLFSEREIVFCKDDN